MVECCGPTETSLPWRQLLLIEMIGHSSGQLAHNTPPSYLPDLLNISSCPTLLHSPACVSRTTPSSSLTSQTPPTSSAIPLPGIETFGCSTDDHNPIIVTDISHNQEAYLSTLLPWSPPSDPGPPPAILQTLQPIKPEFLPVTGRHEVTPPSILRPELPIILKSELPEPPRLVPAPLSRLSQLDQQQQQQQQQQQHQQQHQQQQQPTSTTSKTGGKSKKDRKKSDGPKKKKTRTTFTAYQQQQQQQQQQ